ncbi:3-oxoacyl-ACP reductase FabG [Pseudalkalibacillus hwajinpoensis]|uniref:3-oxoacyl-ACP reductase FabG n=1 Tax=Guptibacillus hwajinpoensis TaxID=208199 RepID=UPI001CD1FA89|nr:3-oxoacyl-ACP reductase FabG [Pseudalkalibacillus hwajinpoensis]MCA0992312.1 3-oxoacyl-ACP reductase FabG [Pseudalkalibacillus hwajinpoensis]
MVKRLEGRVAYITGGSKGIGASIAETFASEGAKVYLADVNEEALSITGKDLEEKGYSVMTGIVDVTDRDQVETSMKEAAEAYGSIDILVNNAGVIRDNLLFKMTDEDWMTVMQVHLTGSFYASRAAQKYMVDQGYGRIISLSSTSALGNRGQTNYAAAKAGIQGLTKTLSLELGKYGITANAIAPGFIETDMTKATAERLGVEFDQFIEYNKKQIPVARTGRPEDIANAALFFADENSSFVSGQVLYVAGGPRA